MNTLRFAVALLFGVSCLTAFAQAENPQTRKEIVAVYRKWDALVAKGDMKGMFAMIDKSFTMTDPDGKVYTYTDMKQMMKSMEGIMKDVKSEITVNQIQESGSEVVAWITMKMSFKQKQGDRWVAMTVTERVAETLRKVNGEWKFFSAQALPKG